MTLAQVPGGNAEPSTVPSREQTEIGIDANQPTIAGYEILGRLGRGGMGVVYQAWQQKLNRLVALKMVRAGMDARPEELTRFQVEAVAVARLQHPNIVQIYEVGEQEGGPYFVMEYVDGGNLAQMLQGTPLPVHRAAQLAQILAGAIHYAHQRGIVHRDLKPENVLLTADGMPKISDFGLAKILVGGGALQTQSGVVLGTPSYMSPEQASGRAREVGPATDVYALGGMLYEMLTGRPPFRAESPLETARQVLFEEAVPPRRLRPRLPQDLETICLMCLQKEPRKRYASAHDLADDLQRFLTGKPITARRTGLLERAWRWCRREPALATLTAALAMVLVSGLLSVTGLWLRAERLRQVAETKSSEAHENFRLARQAVDDYALKVSGDPRLRENLRPLRKELLLTAVPFYEKFAQQRSDDAAVRIELARACMQLGLITRETDDTTKAIHRYERALGLFDQLARESPSDPTPRSEMAQCQIMLGLLNRDIGETVKADGALRESQSLLKRLLSEHPENGHYQCDLARSLDTLGSLYHTAGRTAEAEKACTEAFALRERLVQEHAEVVDYQIDLIKSHNNLFVLYRSLGKTTEAGRAVQHTVDLCRSLAKQYPGVDDYQSRLAMSYNNLAAWYQGLGNAAESKQALRDALAITDGLARTKPEVVPFQSNLARAHLNLGMLCHQMGQLAEAQRDLQEAVALYERLVEQHPKHLDYAITLWRSCTNLGDVLRDSGNAETALPFYKRSITGLTEILNRAPREPNAKQSLAGAFFGRAEALGKLARHSEAIPDWDRAVELDNGKWQGLYRLRRATALARARDHVRAMREANDLVLSVDAASAERDYYALAVVGALAAAAAGSDTQLPEPERARLVDQDAAIAIDLLRRAVAKGYRNLEQLASDKDFDALRSRASFRNLLRKMQEDRTQAN
jgi:serine/threonine protein kinase